MRRRDFLKWQFAGAAFLVTGCSSSSLSGGRLGKDKNTNGIAALSIREAAESIKRGTLTSSALVESCLAAIDRDDSRLHAMVALATDAREEAARCDAEAAAGRLRGPLHGIPLVIKDNIDVRGLPTTMASALFAKAAPAKEDAPVTARLRKAGAIILGKSNMDELAAHVSGRTSFFGPTYNPWHSQKQLSPGGSSSGTASATAAGFCLGGLGTDTGGSVRIPAGWCGLCGIRPTYGQTNVRGVYPRAKSLDVVGPLGRTMQDVELLLRLIAEDALVAALDRPSPVSISSLRLGVFSSLDTVLSPQVKTVYHRTASRFARLGAHCMPVELSFLDDESVTTTINTIRSFEFARDIAADVEGNGESARIHPVPLGDYRRGRDVSKEAYKKALRHKEELTKQVHGSFKAKNIHAFMLPSALFTAPPSNASLEIYAAGRRLMNLFSITSVPTVVFRGGLAEDGLPVGIQLVGPRLSERLLIDAATAFEQEFGAFQEPNGWYV